MNLTLEIESIIKQIDADKSAMRTKVLRNIEDKVSPEKLARAFYDWHGAQLLLEGINKFAAEEAKRAEMQTPAPPVEDTDSKD